MEEEAEDKVGERTEKRDDNMEGPPTKKKTDESAEGGGGARAPSMDQPPLEEVLAEINLVAICARWEEEKHRELLPAVKNCRKATLYTFNEDMDILNSIVQAADSSLRELHLVGNPYYSEYYTRKGLGSVLAALTAPGCKLETLRLSGFPLGHKECKLLACVIKSTHSLLRELDLRCSFLDWIVFDDDDDDDDYGSPSIALSTALMDPTCKLEKFRMSGSHLTSECYKAFTSVLCSNSCLRELDLSNNDLQDSGVKHLSAGLGSPDCRLEILRLSGCKVTEDGCASLASALGSNPSHLRELDLSFNHPGDSGTKLLSDRLKDPNCRLEKLNLDHDEEHWINPQLLKKYDCQLAMDPKTASKNLLLSEGNRRVRHVDEPQPYSDRPERFKNSPVLCRESLTGRSYWEVESRGDNYVGVAYGSIGSKEEEDHTSDELWYCDIHPDRVGFRFFFNHNCGEDTVFLDEHDDFLSCRLGVYLDWPAGVLSFYNVSADAMTHLHTFNATFTEPLYPWFHIGLRNELTLCRIYEINDSRTSFTPDMLTTTEYKFRFPSAGVFKCRSTGLLFGLEGEEEVQYRSVQWDENLIHSAGRTPAGPLFDIQCPQGSVSQLQLPHCLTSAELSCKCLSVVHITDDGLTILEPLRITQTHVVVNVHHSQLSFIGLTWLMDWMFFSPRSMSCQILLLARPPRPDHRVLDVFLLPSNVPLQDVKAQHEESQKSMTLSRCVLTIGQDYSLMCDPETYMLQPESEQFRFLNYGPNYIPTFEVFMASNARKVGLAIKDPRGAVWRRTVDVPLSDYVVGPGPSGDQVPSQVEERLLSVRTQFTERASDHLVDKLLGQLLRRRVINDGEMEAARATGSRESKARYTIDMVRRKGQEASSEFVTMIHDQDPYLFRQLKLN